MHVNMRREPRMAARKSYSISWIDGAGLTRSMKAEGLDLSFSGVGVRCPVELPKGQTVHLQAQDGRPTGYATVRHCNRRDTSFIVGLELDEETRNTNVRPPDEAANYYEFLQISPRAEFETIHRIYRFLAGRFHPDNPQTGDPERFVLLNRAFDVLSDPNSRADYDALLESRHGEPLPAFASVDFMDGAEGEVNRRLAVLSLLYRRCRANVEDPKVSLAELEAQMGFPREYLDFTTWYLRNKKYITREDNSDFALTVLGVDYVESNYSNLPILRKLLNAGTSASGKRRAADPVPEEVFLPGEIIPEAPDSQDPDCDVRLQPFHSAGGGLQEP
jgi:curved DNA-binding protein